MTNENVGKEKGYGISRRQLLGSAMAAGAFTIIPSYVLGMDGKKPPSEKLNIAAKGSYYLASMGVYVFNAAALIKALSGTDADFGKEVIPHSIKELKGVGYVFNGYWKDVGTIRSQCVVGRA